MADVYTKDGTKLQGALKLIVLNLINDYNFVDTDFIIQLNFTQSRRYKYVK